ncbi:conserved protein of unknown function [Pseudomonas marincola]|uniref:Uncharacterized protein n=1 Tax=Pseudomonas marincola TaxID=437900 RepID=A0A653DYY8_9PSED|nr:conserved protein of unknown function [Pseudomonas marincola]
MHPYTHLRTESAQHKRSASRYARDSSRLLKETADAPRLAIGIDHCVCSHHDAGANPALIASSGRRLCHTGGLA